MKKLIIAFIFFSLCGRSLFAACTWTGNTGRVASNNLADVSDCVRDAQSKTGAVVVQLLNASATWGSALSVNMSSDFGGVTQLTIQGAGSLAARGSAGQTVITNGGVRLITLGAKKFRLSNIRFNGNTNGTGMITISGTSRYALGGGWRIDHCDINVTDGQNRAVWVEERTYGVVDSSTLRTTGGVVVGIREQVNGDGGNGSWARGTDFGTSEAVYIEENDVEFVSSENVVHMCIDSEGGGRFVFRNNKAKNCYVGTHDCSSLSNTRSALSWEVYGNTFTTDREYASGNIHLRGGTGFVYNNDLVATKSQPYYGAGMLMTNYRSFDYATAAPWSTPCANGSQFKICVGTRTSAHTCTTDADCGGESGACKWADNPSGNGANYPCRDQIGRGDSTMAPRPSLWWNNRLKKGTGNFENYYPGVDPNTGVSQHIQLSRDYCQATTTMPTSCNSVTTTYRAYTSPHPLRNDAGVVVAAPAAPRNFRVRS